MKNIWIMLLMLCSACAFTACSDDDDKTPEPAAPTATLPETLTAGQEITIDGKDFATDASLLLQNSADAATTFDIEGAAFTATSVTFTLPADMEAGNYKIVVRQNDKEYELGTVEMVVKRLAKVVYTDPWGNSEEYALTYGKDKQIEKIGYIYKDKEGEVIEERGYNVKREGEQILIADGEETETYAYTLKEAKIAGYVDAYDTPFRFEYTDDYLTSVIGMYEEENEEGEMVQIEYPVEYEYTDNNLIAVYGSGLKFGNQKNIVNGVDPVICIYKFILTSISENSDFFPHLLGLCGNPSANLPTSSDGRNGNSPLTYTYEEWGGIKSITCTGEEEVYTIGFEYE